jgi:hypothetical protein
MNVHYSYHENQEQLKSALERCAQADEIQSFICFIADASTDDLNAIQRLFGVLTKPLIGGIVPGLIFNSTSKEEGFLLVGLPYRINYHLIPLEEENSIQSSIDQAMNRFSADDKTIFTLLDAFADNKTHFIHSLYDAFGNGVSYLGGGCGSLKMVQKPILLTNSGFHQNCAIVAEIHSELSIGCAHGWSEISAPLKITESTGNTIHTIDWLPAFEVYRKLIQTHSGEQISTDNFFEVAKSYPLGMAKLEADFVVRDPITSDGTSITIIDEIPVGEFVYLLHGKESNLIEGAKEALDQVHIQHDGPLFCIDCISRILFLGGAFNKELESISKRPVHGILAIGELANSGNTYLEIFNKTIVISQFI